MKRLTLLGTFLLVAFVITGCQLPTFVSSSEPIQRPVPVEGDKTTPDTTTPPDTKTPDTVTPPSSNTITPMENTAPFFKNGSVTFNSEIKEIPTETIITKSLQDEIMTSQTKDWDNSWGNPPKWATDVAGYFNFYDAGTFNIAPYENQSLVILSLQCEGMCFGPSIYRFAYDKSQNKLTLLKNYSSEDRSNMVLPLLKNIDKTTVIKGLILPDKIEIPNSDKYIEIQQRDNIYLLDYKVEFGPVLFVNPEFGNVYYQIKMSTEYPSCVYVESPDGSVSLYGYDPKFMSIGDSNPPKVWIDWKDGNMKTDLAKDYAYVAGGCGMTAVCYMIENIEEKDLTLIGTASNKIDLYVVKNPSEPSTALDKLTSTYETYQSQTKYDKTKPSMDLKTFISKKPILYWKDPFGRWAGLIHRDVQPAAECGKPVIYLYPEKETDVSVKVNIDEFTKTVPEYGNGWKVHAYPDGKIYNYADKQIYPYLFWEGHKKGEITASSGSVVKKEDLNKFLERSLTSLGLNKSEKDEFISFWLPKMQANKEAYCFVSFVGTKDFNKVAPLEIIPAPKTLLRVFMYYQPINTFFKTIPQELKGMDRKGFTVVEWGGTSSRPWQE